MKKQGMILSACLVAASLMAGSAYAKPNTGTPQAKNETKAPQGPKGEHGLLKAIENTKDKPAGAVIANILLTKYGSKLTEEQKADLTKIVDSTQALSEAAATLEENGQVEAAAEVQAEAVKADKDNLDAYKKLGKMKEKLGQKGVKLYVNGDATTGLTPPVIKQGRTLVPFRAIAESLNAQVSWNAEERSVTVTRGDVTIKLFIDKTTAYINGKEVVLDVPAMINNNSTIVPVRFISEALKASVQYEPETGSVVINDDSAEAQPDATASPTPAASTEPAASATPAPEATATPDPATTAPEATATPAPDASTTPAPEATPAP